MCWCDFAHVGYGEGEIKAIGETEQKAAGVEGTVGSGCDLEGDGYYSNGAGDPETDSTTCSGTQGVNAECGYQASDVH